MHQREAKCKINPTSYHYAVIMYVQCSHWQKNHLSSSISSFHAQHNLFYNTVSLHTSLRKQLTFVTPNWIPSNMTFVERLQKFHTDNVSLPRSGWCSWMDWINQSIRRTKIYNPDLGDDTISIEFLHSLSRETSVAKQNVSCFLRPLPTKKLFLVYAILRIIY